MHAVVLCAGKGTRLAPMTRRRPKHLIPVANRPVIAHVFDTCRRVGVERVTVVLSPRQAASAADLARWAGGLRVDGVSQDQPRGLADAVAAAEAATRGDPFVLWLGDTLVSPEAEAGLRDALSPPGHRIICTPVTDPRRYGVVVLDEHGAVTALVEKPACPPSNLAAVGIYRLEPDVFEAIRTILPSPRGELEITDALAWLVARRRRVEGAELAGRWLDTGTLPALLQANRGLIETCGERPAPAACGAVPPVVVGRGTSLLRSTAGPNVALGERCHVRGSRLQDAIVLDGAWIEDIDCRGVLIGEGARIRGRGSASALRNTIVPDGAYLELP